MGLMEEGRENRDPNPQRQLDFIPRPHHGQISSLWLP